MIKAVHIDRKKLFELTEYGEDQAARLGLKVSKDRNQGLEHRYFIEQVKALYLAAGWFPFKEKADIDLVIEKVGRVLAIEVETGKNKSEQTQKNLEKLVRFTADRKIIIAANEAALAKVRRLMADLTLPGVGAIEVVMARDFLKNPPE